MGRPRVHDIPMDEVRMLTESGWRLKKIAHRYNCSAQTILNRMNEAGIPAHPQCSLPMELNPAWKGGRYFDGDGYIIVIAPPDHPFATKCGRIREHRLVMENELGRYLHPDEVVHHKDDDKTNNDPSNLELFSSNGEHLAATLKGKIPNWTKDGLKRIQQRIDHAAALKRKANRNRSKTYDFQ